MLIAAIMSYVILIRFRSLFCFFRDITGVAPWGLRTRSTKKDSVPLTGVDGGHQGSFIDVKIPHSLLLSPKTRRLLKVSPVIKKVSFLIVF